jgi:hypothetical protein
VRQIAAERIAVYGSVVATPVVCGSVRLASDAAGYSVPAVSIFSNKLKTCFQINLE